MGAELPESDATEGTAELPCATAAIDVLRLLIAADTFPRGGLYAGYYSKSAALRYEAVWLTVLREHVVSGGSCPIPPLDVAFAWLVHRQFPVSYANVTHRRCGRAFHPPREVAFAFSSNGQGGGGSGGDGEDGGGKGAPEDVSWKSVAGGLPAWPPPAAGSDYDLVAGHTDWRPTLASQLAASMSRFASLLRSWLRPHFLDALFLERARDRYGRFLDLVAAHPGMTLVPAADIALMWHTHLGLSGEYAAAAKAGLMGLTGADGGASVQPCRPIYLDLEGAPLRVAYNSTARLYEQMFGEPYDCPDTAWLRPAERHPLTGPASPLAFALRVFDEVPSVAAAAAAEAEAEGAGGEAGSGGSPEDRPSQQFHLPPPLLLVPSQHASPRGAGMRSRGGLASFSSLKRRPHPRAGGHALFAAWLASTRAGEFFDRQTCRGLCFRSSWSIKVGAVERMVVPLVLLPYTWDLPDRNDHPFLAAIAQRRGCWSQPLGPLTAEEEAVKEKAVEEAEGGQQPHEGGGERGAARGGQVEGLERGGGGGSRSQGDKEGAGTAPTTPDDLPTSRAGPAEHGPGPGGPGGPGGAGAAANSGASSLGLSEDDASPADPAAAETVQRAAANITYPAEGPAQAPGAGKTGGGGGGGADGRASRGACGGSSGMYSSSGHKLGDAEDFLDDPTMWGLTALMESIAAARAGAGAASGQWGSAPQEEEEDADEGFWGFGAGSGHSSVNPLGTVGAWGRRSRRELPTGGSGGDGRRNGVGVGEGDGFKSSSGGRGGSGVGKRHDGGGPYGGTAPLWGILQKPEYSKRAQALFRHLWAEVGRRGPEFLQAKGLGEHVN